MQISVTQCHIDLARELSHLRRTENCPVALALKSAGFSRPSVVRGYFINQSPTGNQRKDYKFPPEVAEFVDRVDNREKVGPFDFEIET